MPQCKFSVHRFRYASSNVREYPRSRHQFYLLVFRCDGSVHFLEGYFTLIYSLLIGLTKCQTLVKDDCKLESFTAMFNKEVGQAFVKAAFQTTYTQSDNNTITYHSSLTIPAKVCFCFDVVIAIKKWEPSRNLTFQIYTKNLLFPIDQVFFNGNLKTEIDDTRISFKKISDEEKSRLERELLEVHLNHTYTKIG